MSSVTTVRRERERAYTSIHDSSGMMALFYLDDLDSEECMYELYARKSQSVTSIAWQHACIIWAPTRQPTVIQGATLDNPGDRQPDDAGTVRWPWDGNGSPLPWPRPPPHSPTLTPYITQPLPPPIVRSHLNLYLRPSISCPGSYHP